MMNRSWGAKIILGLLGMLIGGPLGLVVGLFIGHMLDKGAEQVRGPADPAKVQAALFDTVFSLMGHLAKADGRVSEDEIAQARAVMDRMQLNEAQRQAAIGLFNRGKQADFPLQETVANFAQTVKHRKQLVLVLLEILLQTALADGQLDPAEERVLIQVAEGLGVSRAQFQQILKMLLAQAQFSASGGFGGGDYAGGQAGPARAPSMAQAYAVLGLDEQASNQEIKRAYRKLMSQHHPDKLAAKGVQEEMIRVATEKTAEISKAYEMIKQQRGFK